MYEFDEGVSQPDRDFWGYNTGEPYLHPNSSGMLDGRSNVMTNPCSDV